MIQITIGKLVFTTVLICGGTATGLYIERGLESIQNPLFGQVVCKDCDKVYPPVPPEPPTGNPINPPYNPPIDYPVDPPTPVDPPMTSEPPSEIPVSGTLALLLIGGLLWSRKR